MGNTSNNKCARVGGRDERDNLMIDAVYDTETDRRTLYNFTGRLLSQNVSISYRFKLNNKK